MSWFMLEWLFYFTECDIEYISPSDYHPPSEENGKNSNGGCLNGFHEDPYEQIVKSNLQAMEKNKVNTSCSSYPIENQDKVVNNDRTRGYNPSHKLASINWTENNPAVRKNITKSCSFSPLGRLCIPNLIHFERLARVQAEYWFLSFVSLSLLLLTIVNVIDFNQTSCAMD